MSGKTDEFLTEWHRIVAEKDLGALATVLAKDISMGAPPYWDKVRGLDTVVHLLGLVIHTIEEFAYHREWCDANELALEFTGRVGEHRLQGIDLLSLDDQCRVHNLDVLMRPVNSVISLREVIAPQMVAYLAKRDENAG